VTVGSTFKADDRIPGTQGSFQPRRLFARCGKTIEAEMSEPESDGSVRYLENAPPDLVDLYRHREDLGAKLIDDRVQLESISMLRALVSDQRMSSVYPKVSARAIELSRSSNFGLAMFVAAQGALISLKGPRHTSKTAAMQFSEISDLAEQLYSRIDEAAAILGSCEVPELMTDDELHELARTTQTPVQYLSDMGDMPRNVGDASSDDEFIEMRIKMLSVIPALPDLLRRFAAATKRRVQSRIWTQPEADSAEVNFFARSISGHFAEQYGRYWDDLVATVTMVALGLPHDYEIDGNDVNQLRRTLMFASIPKPEGDSKEDKQPP
jgi:hypothetical protein